MKSGTRIADVVVHVVQGASVQHLVISGRQLPDDCTHRSGYHFIPVGRGLIKEPVQVIKDPVGDSQGAKPSRQTTLIMTGRLLEMNLLVVMISPESCPGVFSG